MLLTALIVCCILHCDGAPLSDAPVCIHEYSLPQRQEPQDRRAALVAKQSTSRVVLIEGVLTACLLAACVPLVHMSEQSGAPPRALPSATASPTSAATRTGALPSAMAFPATHGQLSPLSQLALWVPDIQWQDPEPAVAESRNPPYGKRVSGYSRKGTGTSATYLVPDIHPRINEALTKQGWQGAFPAESPGGSFYQYTKTEQGKQRIIQLQYQTKSAIVSGPNEPIKFADCPCLYELSVFYSDPFQ